MINDLLVTLLWLFAIFFLFFYSTFAHNVLFDNICIIYLFACSLMTNRLCSWPLGMWFFFACQQYWQITTHAFQFDFLKKKNLFIFALDLFFLFNTQRESSVSIYIYIKSEARSSP